MKLYEANYDDGAKTRSVGHFEYEEHLPMYTALDQRTISEKLRELPAWSGDVHELRAKFEFDDFRGAMQFMNACVDGIDQRNHHPTWINKFNVVEIRLTTFDIGSLVTDKDFEVAQFLEEILRGYGAEFGYAVQ